MPIQIYCEKKNREIFTKFFQKYVDFVFKKSYNKCEMLYPNAICRVDGFRFLWSNEKLIKIKEDFYANKYYHKKNNVSITYCHYGFWYGNLAL